MSSTAKSAALTTSISRGLLLGVYGVVPLALATTALDVLWLGGGVRAALPALPDELPLWTLFFNLPHVVASSLLLADRQYLRHYRGAIAASLSAVAGLFVIHAVTEERTTTWIAAAVLSYHLVGQQVGIAKLLGGCGGWLVEAWKWLAAAVLVLATAVQIDVLSVWAGFGLDEVQLGLVLCVPLTYLAARVWRASGPGIGRLYVVLNQAMFLAFVPLSSGGYSFMSVLMIRVVHDVSAFAFYVAHDANRNRDERHNLLYAALSFTRLPPWVLLIGMSVGLAHLLTRIELGQWLHPVAMVSMFHYCMEAVTWRRTGLHRRAVSLA